MRHVSEAGTAGEGAGRKSTAGVASDTLSRDEPEPTGGRPVSSFSIGGYAVLRRWLPAAPATHTVGRDQQHVQRMIHAIRATLQQVEAIDRMADRSFNP